MIRRPSSTIRVVSGVAVHGGQVLLGKRKPGKLRGELWELPGGKLEHGETEKEAVVREWKEELGLDIRAGRMSLTGTTYLALDDYFEISLVEVHPADPNAWWPSDLRPHALDHTELGWFDPEHAMRYMPCSPGYYLHYLSMMGLIAQGAQRGRR